MDISDANAVVKNVSRETLAGMTIFAIGTPPGRSAVAVIRISGAEVLKALEALTGKKVLPPRQACLLNLREFSVTKSATGAVTISPYDRNNPLIDQALVLYFPAPHSETGEECLELQPHGGPNVLATLCQLLAQIPNIRLAEPGEFIRRAFLNGKMDLTEIEGVADLLAADSDQQRRQALRQMQGGLRKQIEQWRGELLRALAYIEASIDFVEEELPNNLPAQSLAISRNLAREIAKTLGTLHHGEIIRDGFHIALLGAPNAGKSTLLNHFAAREAAIVSSIPGTTRDAISVDLDWLGYRVTVTDTAGIRPTENEIEQIGIKRSLLWAEQADLLLIMVDSQEFPQISKEIAELLQKNRSAMLIASKNDGVSREEWQEKLNSLKNLPQIHKKDQIFPLALPPQQAALAAQNRDQLIAILLEQIKAVTNIAENSVVITRERHRLALNMAFQALTELDAFGGEIDTNAENIVPEHGLEIIAESLRRAVLELDKITGRAAFEDMMSLIFGEFCLGK
ncbi:MAG: tRNA uridine-5-carboxymethylaminomethyl(34) synthesis GTPase MnmE [Alphaproteobacteria bacterium]|nr:tRNA uridine-5-carboxymethylaminomethyl(34) synthesis GTPase MnmE [Alphaproteobacteria bacterium]